MRRFRFHLGTLVILILLLGVGFAAVRESNETWDSSTFSVTLGVLSISILLAVHRTERRQAFWLGFALFGWIYLGLTFMPSIASRLITTKALYYLDSKVPRSIPTGLAYFDYGNDGHVDIFVVNNSQPKPLFLNTGWSSNFSPGPLPKGSSGTTENFVRIGHSLLAVIAALLGGHLSRYLHMKNPRGTSGPSVGRRHPAGIEAGTIPLSGAEPVDVVDRSLNSFGEHRPTS